MIRKLWVKFDELDVECVCNHQNKKCRTDENCKEYVVKFTPVNRLERNNISFSPKKLADRRRKLTSELNKTVDHINNTIRHLK